MSGIKEHTRYCGRCDLFFSVEPGQAVACGTNLDGKDIHICPACDDSRQWTLNKWDDAWRDGINKVWEDDAKKMPKEEMNRRYPGLFDARKNAVEKGHTP